MAVKQSKGFFRDIEGKETFELKGGQKKAGEEGIVMEIGGDQKQVERIFLHKDKGITNLTGNWFIDTYNRFNEWVIEMNGVSTRDLATTFRLLAVMINAGIPLIKSLNTLGVQWEKKPKLARTMFALAKSVEGGKSLSLSMQEYPKIFNDAQIGAVQAGEEAGQLNKTMLDLASELEKNASIAGKVKGAMIYPAAIILIMFAVIVLMLTMVVPQISKLFTESGKELPLPTQILISASDFVIGYWYILLGGLVGLISGIIAAIRTKTGRYYFDYFMISMPVFGPLLRKSLLSKFAHSFGNLLSSGVPIVRSMEIVAAAVGNEVYRRRFLLTAEDMKSGIPMAENLSSSKLFPTMLVNMIEVGEQTAQLENVTEKVAGFYDEEVDEAVKALTKVMEPLIIVLVGITVGGLVAAIMLPIIQLTDLGETL